MSLVFTAILHSRHKPQNPGQVSPQTAKPESLRGEMRTYAQTQLHCGCVGKPAARAGAERSGDDDPPASGGLLLSPEIDHFVMAITAGEAMAQHTGALVLDLWDFCEADHVACTVQSLRLDCWPWS